MIERSFNGYHGKNKKFNTIKSSLISVSWNCYGDMVNRYPETSFLEV